MIKEKRGQFFLIAAVIIGTLLLGLSSLFNTVKIQSTGLEKFNLLCENYYYEVQELNKDNLGNDFENELEDFTINYMRELETLAPEIELIYLYGDENGAIVQECLLETGCNIYSISDPSTTYKIWEREVTLYDYNKFYLIMRQEKNNEVYFCEK